MRTLRSNFHFCSVFNCVLDRFSFERALQFCLTHKVRNIRMASSGDAQKTVRGVLDSQGETGGSGGWDACWKEGVTPWDLGRTTPIISHFVQQPALLPDGAALVPGCGSGYDVIALSSPSRYVVGLDISGKAIARAKELAAVASKTKYCELIEADFFTWNPASPFDLIFDYTFFCAIEPSQRPEWGKHIAELLKPEGELLTLMFPVDDHDGGPPYSVSLQSYEEVLNPWGLKVTSVAANEMAVGRRKGREFLARWKWDGKRFSLM